MFKFELIIREDRDQSQCKSISKDTDISEILQELCEDIESQSMAVFNVSGFGLDTWRTDVSVDLWVILEQFPSFRKELLRTRNGTLDFYEQGQQRLLEFHLDSKKEMVSVSCSSYSNWIPDPKIELVKFSKLNQMFDLFQMNFNDIVKAHYTSIYSNLIFRDFFEI